MLSNMPKSVFNALAALTVAIPVVAWSTLPRVHNVQSQGTGWFTEKTSTGSYINHQGTLNATFSWQEGTLHGFGNLQVKTPANDTFQLKLVRLSSANAYDVYGEWDVSKNGTPTCAGCQGRLSVSGTEYGLGAFKGYVNNSDNSIDYSFSGDVTHRYEY